jgi:hypothetical protein
MHARADVDNEDPECQNLAADISFRKKAGVHAKHDVGQGRINTVLIVAEVQLTAALALIFTESDVTV